jgi:hypothetical protein
LCQLGFPRATASSTCRTFRAAVAQQKYRRSLPLPIPEIKSFSRLSGDFNMFFQSRPDAERSRPVGLLKITLSLILGPQQLPLYSRVAAARHPTFGEEKKRARAPGQNIESDFSCKSLAQIPTTRRCLAFGYRRRRGRLPAYKPPSSYLPNERLHSDTSR